MTAWEELQHGPPGNETVTLIIALTGQLVRTRGFPPPAHHRSWSQQAIEDTVGALFAGKNNSWLKEVQALATDQRSLERLLRKVIENWLIDEAKQTVVGKMRRRLRGLLGRDQQFVNAKQLLAGEDGWTRSEYGDTVWQGDTRVLYRSTAHAAAGPLEPLNTAGPTSQRNRIVIVQYILGVFAGALGALREQLLARFIVERFELEHVEEELSDENEDTQPTPEAQYEIELAADRIRAELTGRDAVVLAFYDVPEQLASRFGITLEEANELVRALLVRLRPLCASTDIGRAGLRIVIEEVAVRQ